MASRPAGQPAVLPRRSPSRIIGGCGPAERHGEQRRKGVPLQTRPATLRGACPGGSWRRGNSRADGAGEGRAGRPPLRRRRAPTCLNARRHSILLQRLRAASPARSGGRRWPVHERGSRRNAPGPRALLGLVLERSTRSRIDTWSACAASRSAVPTCSGQSGNSGLSSSSPRRGPAARRSSVRSGAAAPFARTGARPGGRRGRSRFEPHRSDRRTARLSLVVEQGAQLVGPAQAAVILGPSHRRSISWSGAGPGRDGQLRVGRRAAGAAAAGAGPPSQPSAHPDAHSNAGLRPGFL